MKSWTYEKSGVPHLKGDSAYNKKISKLIRSTHTPGVMGSAIGFSALFDLKKANVNDPLLVAATDGVGTKLEIARFLGIHNTIGIDLVAMCVNDIITCGAKPLFFLDYFAAGKFQPKETGKVLEGITAGCRQAGCSLIGGETAIMPGFYSTGNEKNISAQYDLAGFSVGVVDRRKLITGEKIKKDNILLGIESSGFHSNGYSLLRKVLSKKQLKGKIGKELLKPTIIYVKPILKLLSVLQVKGIINITGGGFFDNIPRVLPKGIGAAIIRKAWPIPKIFGLVQNFGNIPDYDMFRTFNMGIGMVLVLEKSDVKRAKELLKKFNLKSWAIGYTTRNKGVEVL